MIRNTLSKLFGGEIDNVTALQNQVVQLQSQIDSLCINDGTGKSVWNFTFNIGDKYRVYFLNEICATSYCDLISYSASNGDFIQIIHKGQSVKLLKYITGTSSELRVIATGIIVDQNDFSYGFWNNSVNQYGGVILSNNSVGNAHLVKVIKLN